MKFQFNKNTVKFFIKDFPLPSDDIELRELRDKYFEELDKKKANQFLKWSIEYLKKFYNDIVISYNKK